VVPTSPIFVQEWKLEALHPDALGVLFCIIAVEHFLH
jgi:hypothetical protein